MSPSSNIEIVSDNHSFHNTVEDEKRYQIHPRYPQSDKVSIHCLANVLFSARLLSPSSSPSLKPSIIYSLDTPSTASDSLGSYEFQLPKRLELPTNSSLELEVRLEFGNLPGARAGMLCGDEALTCEAGEISRILGEGNGIVGEKIEVLSGKTVRVNKGWPIILFRLCLVLTLRYSHHSQRFASLYP